MRNPHPPSEPGQSKASNDPDVFFQAEWFPFPGRVGRIIIIVWVGWYSRPRGLRGSLINYFYSEEAFLHPGWEGCFFLREGKGRDRFAKRIRHGHGRAVALRFPMEKEVWWTGSFLLLIVT